MKRQPKQQRGFALLIIVVLLMGLGGVVLANIGQQARVAVEQSRFERNREVLQRAKSALLLYAYNYPNFNNEGPGRLPCPDTNGNGEPGAGAGLSTAICSSVGRFPYLANGMNFYDSRDANNQPLWYAVSSGFDNFGGPIINSGTLGTITVFDQTGALLYDGAVDGVAAVIIAPGEAMAGQDRAADPDDPANFLETFNGFSNSAFVNGASANAGDGFRLGPVVDAASNTLVINDQMVVITREELLDVAKAAVLESYRDTIELYRENTAECLGEIPDGETTEAGCLAAATPGEWVRPFPWLDAYDATNYQLDNFDADLYPAGQEMRGRIPSQFGLYFDDINDVDTEQVTSDLSIDPAFSGDSAYLNGEFGAVVTLANSTVGFDDNGDLIGDLTVAYNSTITRYYWEDDAVADGFEVWKLCPAGGDQLSDCNQDSAGNPTPGVANANATKVREVTMTVNIPQNDFLFDFDYSEDPVITYTAPGAGFHAVITGSVTGNRLNTHVTLQYDQDNYYLASFDPGDPTDGSEDIDIMNTNARFGFGLRYYPVLPRWALSNRWHHSMQMVVDDDLMPPLTAGVACADTASPSCITVSNLGGGTATSSILVLAGSAEDTVDDGVPGNFDDLQALFAAQNDFSDAIYDRLAGDDSIMVLQ